MPTRKLGKRPRVEENPPKFRIAAKKKTSATEKRNQLPTAAPRDSSTLRWTPRANALAKCICRYQEPRTALSRIRVARRRKKKLDRSWALQKSEPIYPSVDVVALIFPSHHRPSSPLYQKWAPFGSTVLQYRRSQSACDTRP